MSAHITPIAKDFLLVTQSSNDPAAILSIQALPLNE
jgi:hypothetical protein